MGKEGQARLGRCVAVGCRGNGARRRPLRGGGRHYGRLHRRGLARAGKRGGRGEATAPRPAGGAESGR